MTSDFRSDELFPAETGSRQTGILDPSFDAEFPTSPGSVDVFDPKNVINFLVNVLGTKCPKCLNLFLSPKTGENRKFLKLIKTMSNQFIISLFSVSQEKMISTVNSAVKMTINKIDLHVSC